MTDITGGVLPSHTSTVLVPPAAPPATMIRANELLAEYVGFQVGLGHKVSLEDLKDAWEESKRKAEEETK